MKAFHRFSIILGMILLAVLVWRIGPGSILAELKNIGWWILPLVCLEGVAEGFHTLGWRRCLSATQENEPFHRLLGIKLAGYAMNNLTPTAGIGGEITKAALLAEKGGGAQAAGGVLVGKVTYVLAQLILVIIGSLVTLWFLDVSPALWAAVTLTGGLLLSALGFLFVLQKRGRLSSMVGWAGFLPIGETGHRRLRGVLEAVDGELRAYYSRNPYGLYRAMGWYGVGFACYILQIWWFLHAAGVQASFIMAAGLWCLAGWFELVGSVVPLRLGIQEGGRVISLAAFGYTPALGMALAALIRIQELIWGLVGLLIYPFLCSRESMRRTPGEDPCPRRPFVP